MGNKKQLKKQAHVVALEALDLVIERRRRDLEEQRRDQASKARLEESAWREAKYASKFADRVFKSIEKQGVDIDRDFNIDETLVVQRLVGQRASEAAAEWIDRVDRELDAEPVEEEALEINRFVEGVMFEVNKYVHEDDPTHWLRRVVMNEDEAFELARYGYHEGADVSCALIRAEEIKSYIDERIERRNKEDAYLSADADDKEEVEYLIKANPSMGRQVDPASLWRHLKDLTNAVVAARESKATANVEVFIKPAK